MNIELRKKIIELIANAGGGHIPSAFSIIDILAYLYEYVLKFDPKNPSWPDRDRFVLSAGHGSMWLYSLLHLSGFNLTMDDLKSFRQLHSKTPGHPEFHITDGVEATTGPLGQGVGNAVGQAFALKMLESRFNSPEYPIFSNKVFCLAGDGCMMEGVSSEASSFAGHLQLNNLVLIHDANKVTLDGFVKDSCSEDVKMRYKAYGWDVYDLDGYDFDKMDEIFTQIRQCQERPVFISMHTIIGKGSPNKAGTHKVHGSPLGVEEVAATKKALGLPEEDFYVPQSVYKYFEQRLAKDAILEQKWKEMFKRWSLAKPDLYKEFMLMVEKKIPETLEEDLRKVEIKPLMATRSSSQVVLCALGNLLPQIYGGSADLSSSDMTMMKQFAPIVPGDFSGRNIRYGIREFGMATIASGMSQTDMIFPYIGTFLTFSDYMKNAVRLAAFSNIQVVYQFTHDSVFVGEDGPTHQPVEQLAGLRAIPNLRVIRPSDNCEVKMAWLAAIKYRGPTAIILSRQAVPELSETNVSYEKGMGRGAYILKGANKKPDFTFFATGSEVTLALDTAAALEKAGKAVRVISMPCWELFEEQSIEYKNSIVGGDLGQRVSIEAATSFGWAKWIGFDGISIAVDTFGVSAPQSDIAAEFGFTVDAILTRLLS